MIRTVIGDECKVRLCCWPWAFHLWHCWCPWRGRGPCTPHTSGPGLHPCVGFCSPWPGLRRCSARRTGTPANLTHKQNGKNVSGEETTTDKPAAFYTQFKKLHHFSLNWTQGRKLQASHPALIPFPTRLGLSTRRPARLEEDDEIKPHQIPRIHMSHSVVWLFAPKYFQQPKGTKLVASYC